MENQIIPPSPDIMVTPLIRTLTGQRESTVDTQTPQDGGVGVDSENGI